MKIASNHSLCPVLLCLGFICLTMSVQNSIRVERNQSKHLEGEKQVHHRPKRGWVWNQFFVLEEHIGPEAQYVGKLHSNADKGDGTVKYILSGEGAGSIFVIDDSTGDIHATKSLDREQRIHYILHAQALDRKTNKPLEPESEFIIKVQDINDNAPTFLEGPYSASVPEMSEVGTSVLQITATDADDPTYGNSARVVYSILQGQPYFSVDPNTGIIRTALPNMDREAREQYSVVIQAKDMAGQIGGLSGSTTINITLTDANDNPPRFPQKNYQLYVPESATVGTAVGKIKATDPDIGVNADMKYSIIDGDGLGIFTISTDKDTREGVIILKKPLNYEKKKVFTVTIEGENTHIDPRFWNLGPFKDAANLKIIIGDVDEPPVFSVPFYIMDVYENTKQGTVVGAVTAQDPDNTKNLVRYFMDQDEEAESYFNIEANSGVIRTMQQLDREVTPWHNITVIASELDNPSQLTQVPVAIHVLDVNDNTPELSEDYDTILCENAKPGQVIQTVRAVDKDDFANGPRFYFSFVEGFPPNPNFTLRDNKDSTASIMIRQRKFSRHLQEVYQLPVVVSDSGTPILSSTGTLTIRVCACERNGKVRTCSAEAYLSAAGLSTGALIAILLCIVILLAIIVLFITLKRSKKEPLIISEEDIRENVVTYDDEGGGEEDTEAFDITTLRNPAVAEEVRYRRDVQPDVQPLPRHRPPSAPNGPDIHDFIAQKLQEADLDISVPPYDSLQTYAYEGHGSIAGSISSLDSVTTHSEQDYNYIGDWGPQFKKLSELYGVDESERTN
ncbi:cadherin-18-like isoform X1 [Scyliorhinus canicula]|uniref:cadherin-18-like isoform X1 n=2 Tax=Scyliorhinus canicula TaxID=7830 RepID=UPI0018F7B57E|nr:cadherin-18-like isoform X1 [Scyliorhinus canicula]XP_038652434.1 cadherin-18-like isoform X1 [Scyliorhinus canicula]XP_038652435.1 cadherin-18-like isoform X1 [Scyliorhinus canicula]XP_038652437.1 cadherin-18-like isoform X1 [Scyliorhinus canicula]XP_038652438.1 cadherin-18-like isoform X1 [Scyliorhinus canicula]XP_038652439.1 cadherin-18-like isoform X1 [Scyliorhinus canicula]XP_038652440.1 cadherin-18-like isoform X1 [Scyliorhinus canicula]XP_038652441.1 cadherin-18-like isoform X1 [Sc